MKIIDRYIFKEIFFLFVLILFILTAIALLGKALQLMDLLINKGLSAIDLGRLFLYLFPNFLSFTLPVSLLTAILIGLGRLSSESEIIALKAGGISLFQLLSPVAAVSTLVFALTFLTVTLAPSGNQALKGLLFDMASKMAGISIKEKVFNTDFKGLTIYADRVPGHGGHLEGVLIYDQRSLNERGIFIAKKAVLLADPRSQAIYLRLEDGGLHLADPSQKHYRLLSFTSYDVRLNMASSPPQEANPDQIPPSDLSLFDLRQRYKSAQDKHAYLGAAKELNRRFSVPFSCLVFGLLGLPLGIRATRSVKARGFTVGLIIVMSYYLLQLAGDALAEKGQVHPTLGVWSPNILFTALGLVLFTFSAKERRLNLPGSGFLRGDKKSSFMSAGK